MTVIHSDRIGVVTLPESHANRCCPSSENGGRGCERNNQVWDPGLGIRANGTDGWPCWNIRHLWGHSLVCETQLFPEDPGSLLLGSITSIAATEPDLTRPAPPTSPRSPQGKFILRGREGGLPTLAGCQQEPFSAPRPPCSLTCSPPPQAKWLASPTPTGESVRASGLRYIM